MPDPAKHPYQPADCAKLPRHYHEYKPPASVAQRCPRGHRMFIVRVGGPLPAQVSCTECREQNRTATAYERGRADAAGI
jgi:hypothetical protein